MSTPDRVTREREARWPETCPLCSHDFGRDAVVFDLATHVAVRHADEMKAWLAALSTQEEAGAEHHHNALACRYCTDDEAFASEARRRGWVLAPQVAQPGDLGVVRDAYVEGFRDAAHDGKPSNEADAWWTISEARSRFYRQRSETHADSDFRASALRRVVSETGDLMDRLYAAGGLATGALCIEASQALEGLLLLVQDGEAEIASRRATPPVAGSRETEEREWEELRKAAAELWDIDPDGWPEHGNTPLAIAAGIALAKSENERLRRWVDDLQSGMYVNCVYCGHRYGPGDTTPVSMADALKAHIEVCPDHPMSALKAEVERLRAPAPGTGECKHEIRDERPQEHWLNAIAEYTVHAPNCPFYEDGNCECAVEEFRATLRRVLVPSNLRAPSEGAREAGDRWRPWSTVPRDGRMVLGLFGPDWIEGVYAMPDGSWHWHDGDSRDNPPICWMPLPAPPEHGEPSDG